MVQWIRKGSLCYVSINICMCVWVWLRCPTLLTHSVTLTGLMLTLCFLLAAIHYQSGCHSCRQRKWYLFVLTARTNTQTNTHTHLFFGNIKLAISICFCPRFEVVPSYVCLWYCTLQRLYIGSWAYFLSLSLEMSCPSGDEEGPGNDWPFPGTHSRKRASKQAIAGAKMYILYIQLHKHRFATCTPNVNEITANKSTLVFFRFFRISTLTLNKEWCSF